MPRPDMELLRFLTCGSVDDGKSTLIGRLLHDSRAVYEDQIENVRKNSRDGLELAFITDGLRAEREQGITIDVAYRYFATARRRFIIADTPGHEQYTRNMATGASTAGLAVILVDARKGLLPQTRRHAYIAHLLGIRRILVAVNKMDSVGYAQPVFEAIRAAFLEFARRLPGAEADFIPVSALAGDNVVRAGENMPWHDGPSLLEYLETVPVRSNRDSAAFRLPVQYVIRSREGGRCYSGQIASGTVKPGDELVALPSGRAVRVAALPARGADWNSASAPRSVALALDDHVDLGRGDMLADPAAPPTAARRFSARLVWMSERPLAVGRPYLLKHCHQVVCAEVTRLECALDIHSLEERPAEQLALNEIGTVEIETHKPLCFDPYEINRTTGSFVVIDPRSNGTEAAGMIRRALDNGPAAHGRPAQAAQTGLAVWFTGLSSAGKSTLAHAVYERLWAAGLRVEILDGDAVRENLSKGLGFSREDRDENIRRIAFVAQLLVRNGVIVLVSAISPYRAVRDEARHSIGSFVEVYVNASLETCEKRDLKGIYRKGRAGLIRGVTGLDDPYEAPENPEVECRTDRETLAESVDQVIRRLRTDYGLG